MGTMTHGQGFYSLLRWRRDVARDEARNVAVLLVDADGCVGSIKHAPVSTISPRLRDQGLLDAVLAGLEQQFSSDTRPNVDLLRQISNSLQRSLYLTEPVPTALPDGAQVLEALYRAYVAPRGGGRPALTKGRVLDQVVTLLRGQGLQVGRGQYVNDFLFDVVVEDPGRVAVMEVLSFASRKKVWTDVEYDAGHFLYALRNIDRDGIAIVQPPEEETPSPGATEAYQRILGWFEREQVPHMKPTEITDHQLALAV